MKYKRCHEDADKRIERARQKMKSGMNVDAIAAHLGEIAATKGFAAQVEAPTKHLRDAFLEEIENGLEGREAAEAIESYLDRLEQELSVRIASHSLLYWLQLTRRLQPDPIGDSSDWTVALYRRVLDLAILKFARPAREDPDLLTIDFGAGPHLFPKVLSHADGVAVHALEYLAYEYNAVCSAFRRVGKGAVLRVADDDFATPASPELQTLMERLDARVDDHATLSGTFGARVSTSLGDGDDSLGAVMGVAPNLERHPPDALIKLSGMKVPGPTNFVPGFFRIDGLRRQLMPFGEVFRANAGAEIDAVLAAIWGCSMILLRELENSPEISLQVFRTGY